MLSNLARKNFDNLSRDFELESHLHHLSFVKIKKEEEERGRGLSMLIISMFFFFF